MTELRSSISSKETPENEKTKKIVNIVEKILEFNKQQKGKGRPSNLAHVAKVFERLRIKILTPKQML